MSGITTADQPLVLEPSAIHKLSYGLYVLSVNGISADWDKEGAWWSFLVDGEASLTGVDSVAIEEGKVYSFVKTKE